VIVIGSRGSKLALWQAGHVGEQLKALGIETRIEIIKTSGDRIQDVPLSQAGGKALFTKEIDEALLSGAIDLAVHSMKDVPTGLPAGLTIAAIPEREEPRDAMIGCSLAGLRDGLRVGTSSLRRQAQLLAYRPQLDIQMLRGNVDTRLRKLEEKQYDAIVLAAAGLRRLGWQDRITELIPVEIMCPAVGQGALAIETREDGGAAYEMVRKLDHPDTRIAVTAERAMLEVLGGGCTLPVGGYAFLEKGVIHMCAVVSSIH
jgi:hydroxymethylbilane synthase